MMQLMSEAADQENKEALLAYTAVALEREPPSVAGVKTACEQLLAQMNPETEVDFDAEDAVSTLASYGVFERTAEGRVQVRSAHIECMCRVTACRCRAVAPCTEQLWKAGVLMKSLDPVPGHVLDAG
jgi:hypothetical protein